MKRLFMMLTLSAFIMFSSTLPAFSANTTDVKSTSNENGRVIVEQEPGYVVTTVKNNSKSPSGGFTFNRDSDESSIPATFFGCQCQET